MADPSAVHHCPGCPNAPGAEEPTLHRRVQGWAMRCAIAGVIVTIGCLASPANTALDILGSAGVTVAFLAGLLWLFLFLQPMVRAAIRGIDDTTTPLPSPAVVAAQFHAEFGRYPSAAEVQVIYTYLQDQRRQGLLGAGVLFGGLLLAAHQI